jgi:hypothetical protein
MDREGTRHNCCSLRNSHNCGEVEMTLLDLHGGGVHWAKHSAAENLGNGNSLAADFEEVSQPIAQNVGSAENFVVPSKLCGTCA